MATQHGSKGGYKNLTQKDVTLVKTLLDAGISGSRIKEITGRGAGTVVLIKQSNGTIEDYHRLQTAQAAKYKPIVSKTPEVVYDSSVVDDKKLEELNQTVTGLRHQIDHLTEVLDWIAENAIIETKKKRFF